jgi:hypothetical protein
VDVLSVSIHRLHEIWYVWMSFIQKNKSVFPEWWKTMFFFRATYVHVGPSYTSLTGLSPSLNISYLWLLWLFNTRLFLACLFCMDWWILKMNVQLYRFLVADANIERGTIRTWYETTCLRQLNELYLPHFPFRLPPDSRNEGWQAIPACVRFGWGWIGNLSFGMGLQNYNFGIG